MSWFTSNAIPGIPQVSGSHSSVCTIRPGQILVNLTTSSRQYSQKRPLGLRHLPKIKVRI